MSLENKTIGDLVRAYEELDRDGQTTSSKFVTQNMREDINTTEAYLNSKHISGDTDHMGREKPFFNIVIAARNIWYRATDIDRRDIKVRPSASKDEIPAFLASVLLQQWMKEEGFGKFLNDWGLTLASHGSAVSKFIEKDGKLSAQVVDWNNLLCDQVDFESNPKIEKLWFTPAQLKKQKGYDKELVKKLLETQTSRQTVDGQQKDNKADYIPVYEVHGELPLSYLTGKESDEDEYVQQMHIISFSATKDDAEEYEEYTLYSGREAKDPYYITHLIKKDGQTYAGGAVKNLFQAQWMVNHNQKQIKDQLDLASKIVFQTSDGAFSGNNVLTNIENGEILTHKMNEPLTMLNNKPDIGAMQNSKADWQNIAMQINGINEAMVNAPKSGTAWRQTQAALQESHDLFELMTENKGLALIDMLTTYVIPFFKKKLDTSKEVAAMLEEHQIKEFDARYIPNETIRRVNEKKKKTILSGQIYDPSQEPMDMATAQGAIQGELMGNTRFIKPSDVSGRTWKDLFKDLEWKLDIDVTSEAKDVQSVMATLTTVFQTIVGNPGVLADENVRMVFNKILTLSGGISPLEISAPKAQQVPAMAGVGGLATAQPNPTNA